MHTSRALQCTVSLRISAKVVRLLDFQYRNTNYHQYSCLMMGSILSDHCLGMHAVKRGFKVTFLYLDSSTYSIATTSTLIIDIDIPCFLAMSSQIV